jgi:peptidyl-prolyl cis-trans isomerase B (cyclophilin B)
VAPNKNQEREAREARDRLKRYTARQTVNATQKKRRKRDNVIALAVVVVVVAVATFFQVSYFTTGPGMPEPQASETPAPEANQNIGDIPAPTYAEGRTWTGDLTLNKVKLGIELDGAAAPQAVSAFVKQVQDGYFTGKTCHRLVVSDGAKLIQCGSLDGVGGADPEYAFGPVENAPENDLYVTGTIAMARVADMPYSQGHQFFITFGDSTFPSDTAGGYTVIGKVTSGLDGFVSQIADGGFTQEANGSTSPKIPTSITAITVK